MGGTWRFGRALWEIWGGLAGVRLGALGGDGEVWRGLGVRVVWEGAWGCCPPQKQGPKGSAGLSTSAVQRPVPTAGPLWGWGGRTVGRQPPPRPPGLRPGQLIALRSPWGRGGAVMWPRIT